MASDRKALVRTLSPLGRQSTRMRGDAHTHSSSRAARSSSGQCAVGCIQKQQDKGGSGRRLETRHLEVEKNGRFFQAIRENERYFGQLFLILSLFERLIFDHNNDPVQPSLARARRGRMAGC